MMITAAVAVGMEMVVVVTTTMMILTMSMMTRTVPAKEIVRKHLNVAINPPPPSGGARRYGITERSSSYEEIERYSSDKKTHFTRQLVRSYRTTSKVKVV